MADRGRELAAGTYKIVDEYYKAGCFNGRAEVIFKGRMLLHESFGYADLSIKKPITGKTRFLIGSNTKQFTSAIIFKLVSQGKLNIHQYIRELLPWFREDFGNNITVYQLLTHTSGMPSYTDTPGFNVAESFIGLTIQEIIELISCRELQFEPGTKFKYSNTNYYILGGIIEQLTGKPYHCVLEEYITIPLQLSDTGCLKDGMDMELFAEAYSAAASGIEKVPLPRPEVFFSTGNMYSSSDDMARWLENLISGDVIAEPYKNIAFRPVYNNYACGIACVEVGAEELGTMLKAPLEFVSKSMWRGERVYRFFLHRGAAQGFNSFWVMSPELGMTVLLLSCFQNYIYLEEIIYKIMKVLIKDGGNTDEV